MVKVETAESHVVLVQEQSTQEVVVVARIPPGEMQMAAQVDLEWLLFVTQDLKEAQVVQCPHRVDSLITHLLVQALTQPDVLLRQLI